MTAAEHPQGRVWRGALELAWEAYRAGTIPVGAVITDADGTVLSSGRNRINDTNAPAGQIFGSRVAHAEINALVQLPVDRTYRDCTLWTTLEPCAQCVAAAWISSIGCVVYAAPDVYAGASKLVEREIEATDRVRTFPMKVDGPAVGATALLAELFVVSHFVERRPVHHVTDALRRLRPELVALVESVRLTEHVGLTLDAVEAVVFAAAG